MTNMHTDPTVLLEAFKKHLLANDGSKQTINAYLSLCRDGMMAK